MDNLLCYDTTECSEHFSSLSSNAGYSKPLKNTLCGLSYATGIYGQFYGLSCPNNHKIFFLLWKWLFCWALLYNHTTTLRTISAQGVHLCGLSGCCSFMFDIRKIKRPRSQKNGSNHAFKKGIKVSEIHPSHTSSLPAREDWGFVTLMSSHIPNKFSRFIICFFQITFCESYHFSSLLITL